MGMFFIIISIVTVGFIVYAKLDADERKMEDYWQKVKSIEEQFNRLKCEFDYTLASFFSDSTKFYQDTFSHLAHIVNLMGQTYINLPGMSTSLHEDYENLVKEYVQLASDFNNLGMRVNQLPYTIMMDISCYGRIEKEYWEFVYNITKDEADKIISDCEYKISSKNYSAINIEAILDCVWVYATKKPYSAMALKKAVSIFDILVKRPYMDVTIAELYAMNQMGGEDILNEHIRKMLKQNYDSKQLTLIASALMWMHAYQIENIVLRYMLSTGMQMSAKAQERLHSLTNGGAKAPSAINVSIDKNFTYFDVSAITWKEEEYIGFFENLAFQEKMLSYSLAVRDEDKELFITQEINLPDTNVILRKLESVFAEEYSNIVKASLKKCIALSVNGEERMESILVESKECKQMGILVYMVRIGKKLNIKFYTLFMPSEVSFANNKQQAISLYKKLSPSVTMWESSMKDTILMAIQQLLNAESQEIITRSAIATDNDALVF